MDRIDRGDLFRVAFKGEGHRIDGPHYAVVVSDEPYNWLSTVVVVPFSTGARPDEIHPETTINGIRTRAMVEQLQAIDKTRLKDRLGSLAGHAIMDLIDEQLRYLLALDC
ncbi:MAG: type II toxin-antitoxin system PemK/MazF family toxin [Chloroflexota bacterium]